MSDDLVPGTVVAMAPGVRRLIAPNPGLMTGPGTNTWLLGEREVAVLDPGPAIPSHLAGVLEAAAGKLRWILVTHTHTDHSPGAMQLAEATGATVVGRPPPAAPHHDAHFHPKQVPEDGEVLVAPGFSLEILHTPGHASNHLCFLHRELKWLFTGDHIIQGSTVVIDPPDGSMSAYLASLERLRELDLDAIAPGHGRLIQAPRRAIDALIAHRLAREAKVLESARSWPGATTSELLPRVYEDVAASLLRVAERSLVAHLEKLADDGRIRQRNGRWYPLS